MQEQNSSHSIKAKAFKVILVGPQSVGKSSILNRVSDGTFNANYNPTIGIDFKTYQVEVGSQIYSLQIWDTAGQQKFRSITSSYYKGSHGCVCVFDINDEKSLQNCKYYIEKALQEKIPPQCIYLLGNKNDLGQSYEQAAKNFAQEYSINLGKGSAKNGQGLTAIFNNLGCKMAAHFGGITSTDSTKLKPKLTITQANNCRC